MYTTGEIAAQLCLETPGLDTLDIAVFWGGSPTIASTQTILVNAALAKAYYLEQNQYVEWHPDAGLYQLAIPGQHELGAGAALGRHLAPGVVQARPARGQRQGAGRRVQPAADAGRAADRRRPRWRRPRTWTPTSSYAALAQTAAGVMNEMPPRENPRINKSLDSVHASGPLGRAHCVIYGNCNYKQTGLLQAYAAYSLLQQQARLLVVLLPWITQCARPERTGGGVRQLARRHLAHHLLGRGGQGGVHGPRRPCPWCSIAAATICGTPSISGLLKTPPSAFHVGHARVLAEPHRVRGRPGSASASSCWPGDGQLVVPGLGESAADRCSARGSAPGYRRVEQDRLRRGDRRAAEDTAMSRVSSPGFSAQLGRDLAHHLRDAGRAADRRRRSRRLLVAGDQPGLTVVSV